MPVVCIQQNPPHPPNQQHFSDSYQREGGGPGMLAGGREKGRGGGVFWGISKSCDTAKMGEKSWNKTWPFSTYILTPDSE